MANICMTNVTINSIDGDFSVGIKKLATLAEEFYKNNRHRWLGAFAAACGVATITYEKRHDIIIGEARMLDGKPLSCRGEISDFDYDDHYAYINFYVEDAWGPHLAVFKELVERLVPDGEIIFIAEEPGFDLYVTNDPTLIGKYYFDNWGGLKDARSEFEMDEDGCEALISKINVQFEKEIKDIFGRAISTFDDVKKLTTEADVDFSIHKWEGVTVDDFLD